MEHFKTNINGILPRSQSSQDYRTDLCNLREEESLYDMLSAEESVSTARPDRAFSVTSNRSFDFQKIENVNSSYKGVKTSFIIVCVLNVFLFFFGMVLLTVFLVISVDKHHPNFNSIQSAGMIPSENRQQQQQQRQQQQRQQQQRQQQVSISTSQQQKPVSPEDININCTDLNRYLNSSEERNICSLKDIHIAAEKKIEAEIRNMKVKSVETAQKVCSTHPLIQMEGSKPDKVADPHNQFQSHMKVWNVADAQIMNAEISNGEINIDTEGMYFIYSRLELEGQGEGRNPHSVTQTVQMKKFAKGRFKDLHVTRHKCPGDKNIHSVSLESMFHVRKGAKLKVVFKYPKGITPTVQHVGIFKV